MFDFIFQSNLGENLIYNQFDNLISEDFFTKLVESIILHKRRKLIKF